MKKLYPDADPSFATHLLALDKIAREKGLPTMTMDERVR